MSADRALNRVAKWRTLFAGWQLGTRPKGDPESDAVRDHREATIILRVEASAIVALLIEKGLITADEFAEHIEREADLLSMAFEAKFPGATATDEGIALDMARAAPWLSRWRP